MSQRCLAASLGVDVSDRVAQPHLVSHVETVAEITANLPRLLLILGDLIAASKDILLQVVV